MYYGKKNSQRKCKLEKQGAFFWRKVFGRMRGTLQVQQIILYSKQISTHCAGGCFYSVARFWCGA